MVFLLYVSNGLWWGVIFFSSGEKSSLGASKEMFIHLRDSRHTPKQETKLGVYPLTEKRDPAAHP